ncbi:Zinc finger CCCH domain-containing protein 67 [Heracleum sosnowskyi]|uniref:Zinc finger CCCH domain-containing protein 67 n=1 Tax=Heracleum sosnowskyi TaxID=360622 RepID=A0AAD8H033_9APIA|nr:Zinc finger CCCH domain-containing protein 67 [Heracleum sosnowskyi]
MERVRDQFLQNQHMGLAFGSLNFSDHIGLEVSSDKNADVLSQEVQNLAPEDSMKGNGTVEGSSRHFYPLRPEAENCLYFMRYGWCKYRANCRYNHPFNRKGQADYEEIAKENVENLNRMAQVECKYYLTPEGCKHGKDCRYNHSGQKTEKAPVLGFNFLGLPIRPGEKECPQYKLNGSCKYGSNCWFDHPDPSSMGEGFPLSGYTGWEHAMPFWPSAAFNGFGPVEAYSYQPAQYAPYSEWIGYQVPLENQEAPMYTTSGGSLPMPQPVSSTTPASDIKTSQQKRQHPAPNKQPQSSSKSGNGFPRPKPSSCPVNDKGLPLRPEMEVCPFYNHYGICKRGRGCKFDHPVRAEPVAAAESKEAHELPDPTNC